MGSDGESSPARVPRGAPTSSPVSPGALGALAVVVAAVAVGAFGLTSEATLGIDLGTTYSVAATCEGGVATVVPAGAPLPSRAGDAHPAPRLPTVPSVVHFFPADADAAPSAAPPGSVLVGAPAAALRAAAPERTVYDAKRLIGRAFDDPIVQREAAHLPFPVVALDPSRRAPPPSPRRAKRRWSDGDGGASLSSGAATALSSRPAAFAIRDLTVSPEDVGAHVLSHLKRAAESTAVPSWRRAFGFSFGAVTVSVPVGFDAARRSATVRAAKLAGFGVVRLMEEPVAAAIAYGLHEDPDADAGRGDRTVLVYDLGGGTLDVAVLRLERATKTFMVMGVAGDDRLGGEDFDRALLEWLERELASPRRQMRIGNGDGARESALRAMETAKRALADADAVAVHAYASRREPWLVASLEVADPSRRSSHRAKAHTTVTMTRADLESACAHLLARAMAPVHEALRLAGELAPEDIRDVALVGGSTRLRAVRARLAETFPGIDIKHGVDPDTAVAEGAARSYAC
jgi:molecular chaperone DnaK (HSP70)